MAKGSYQAMLMVQPCYMIMCNMLFGMYNSGQRLTSSR